MNRIALSGILPVFDSEINKIFPVDSQAIVRYDIAILV